MGRDSIPNLSEGVKIKVEIVIGVQHRRKNFIREEQMSQISAAVVPANPASAGFVHGFVVSCESCILDHDVA